MIAGKTKTIIACGAAIAVVLLAVGKVRKMREPAVVSEISYAHSLATAWLIGQYADNGVYPRELPALIEYGGEMVELPRRRRLRYEVTEQGARCVLSWTFGRHSCKETWEKGKLTDRTTAGLGGPGGK